MLIRDRWLLRGQHGPCVQELPRSSRRESGNVCTRDVYVVGKGEGISKQLRIGFKSGRQDSFEIIHAIMMLVQVVWRTVAVSGPVGGNHVYSLPVTFNLHPATSSLWREPELLLLLCEIKILARCNAWDEVLLEHVPNP